MDSTVVFVHERLAVFQRAREFAVQTAELLRALPRGETALADQLRRASDSVLLNIAEGAGRAAWPDKARFYEIARGSSTECAAILTLLAIRGLAPAATLDRARGLLHEVVCMLTALARSARQRGATPSARCRRCA